MRNADIGPWHGGWVTARKPFRCEYWNGTRHCGQPVVYGEEYYDTRERDGVSMFWKTIRICRACAEATTGTLTGGNRL